MMTQIENTPDGYIVGAYLRDVDGRGRWVRLRNFGEHQGDAMAFREFDLPTFSFTQIRIFARTFRVADKYRRMGKCRYIKE